MYTTFQCKSINQFGLLNKKNFLFLYLCPNLKILNNKVDLFTFVSNLVICFNQF